MMKVIAEGVTVDDAPMESFAFHGAGGEASLDVDTEDQKRVRFAFQSVVAFRFAPMPDRRALMVDGVYRRTLLVNVSSAWAQGVSAGYEAAGEPLSRPLQHFVVPGDDGVWEVLAFDAQWVVLGEA